MNFVDAPVRVIVLDALPNKRSKNSLWWRRWIGGPVVMDKPRQDRIRQFPTAFSAALAAMLTVNIAFHSSAAPRFTQDFSGAKTSWQFQSGRGRIKKLSHRRAKGSSPTGSYEYLKFQSRSRSAIARISHRLPAAVVIEDLKFSVRYIANRNGATVSLRVVFPKVRNPQTGGTLSTLIAGDRYTTSGKWQTLTCSVSDRQIRRRIREFREKFSRRDMTSDGMYIDGAVIAIPADPGTLQVGISDLRFGPIVAPKPETIRQTVATTQSRSPLHPVEFRLDRMRVRGFPFVPRITAYHGERPELLKSSGCNVIWIPQYDDRELIAALERQKLWITATPPGSPNKSRKSNRLIRTIEPFDSTTRSILFWNIGTRIPTSERKALVSWTKRIRQADRRFDRPILGDVIGDERVLSRYIPMLGSSRHVLQTGFSFLQYRDWLIQKRRIARPGSFVWTWIQTEAAVRHSDTPKKKSGQIVVEPEQLRLQLYAAVAGGCRGFGFWKTTRLDSKQPGAAERRLTISLLNSELDLLAPWISTGTVVGQNAFSVSDSINDRIDQRRLDFRSSAGERYQRNALLNALADRRKRRLQQGRELQAAVIQSDYGTLLLPIWYETGAQFVPGKMTANNAKILVHGVSRSASVWEISTTSVRSLVHERVTGGIRVTIPKFDQTASIVVTSNRRLIEQLRKRINGIAPRSARLWVELASAKFERVRVIDNELSTLGHRQPDSPQLLRKASRYLTEAKSSLQRKDYDATRLMSGNAMQLLRILQRAHWNDAVRRLASPVSSPYTVSFQTLPEHWRMIRRFSRSKPAEGENALRSGDFEDIGTMIAEGWRHTQNAHESVRSVAELYPKAKQGQYNLRLVAAPVPGKEPPSYLSRPSVTVTSPSMTVRSGQFVQVSGWVRVAVPIVGNADGAVLYDSIGGYRRALRWKSGSGWQRFTLIREAIHSGEFHLSLKLNGMGEIHFDDFRVRILDPSSNIGRVEASTRDTPRNRTRTLLDRLPRLPSMPKLPSLRRFGIRR